MVRVLYLIIAVVFISGCTIKSDNKTFDYGFKSKEKLIQYMSTVLIHGTQDEFERLLVTKKEFAEIVYPNLPEAKQKAPMSVSDFWNMLEPGRQEALRVFFSQYNNTMHEKNTKQNVKLEIKIEDLHHYSDKKTFDDVTIYYQNKIKITTYDIKSGKKIEKTDIKLFDAIVCVNGLCRLQFSNDD